MDGFDWDEFDKGELAKAFDFVRAAHRATDHTFGPAAFPCPMCGGEAKAAKAAYNGHVHARCQACGFGMME